MLRTNGLGWICARWECIFRYLTAVQDYALFGFASLAAQDFIIKNVIRINEGVERLVRQEGFPGFVAVFNKLVIYRFAPLNDSVGESMAAFIMLT